MSNFSLKLFFLAVKQFQLPFQFPVNCLLLNLFNFCCFKILFQLKFGFRTFGNGFRFLSANFVRRALFILPILLCIFWLYFSINTNLNSSIFTNLSSYLISKVKYFSPFLFIFLSKTLNHLKFTDLSIKYWNLIEILINFFLKMFWVFSQLFNLFREWLDELFFELILQFQISFNLVTNFTLQFVSVFSYKLLKPLNQCKLFFQVKILRGYNEKVMLLVFKFFLLKEIAQFFDIRIYLTKFTDNLLFFCRQNLNFLIKFLFLV